MNAVSVTGGHSTSQFRHTDTLTDPHSPSDHEFPGPIEHSLQLPTRNDEAGAGRAKWYPCPRLIPSANAAFAVAALSIPSRISSESKSFASARRLRTTLVLVGSISNPVPNCWLI